MTEKKRYDLIVIGSGPAGLAALEAAVEAGAKRTALVESYRRLGGECPNWGCMPTKSLLQTVDILEHCGRGGEFGVPSCGGRADFNAARRRQRQLVDLLTGGPRLANHIRRLGAELVHGRAEFVGPDKILVGKRRLVAKKFVVCTGAETSVPPIPGLDRVKYLTAAEALVAERPPKSMLIIGGGPIGVEFSKIFSVFGTKVTVVEAAGHVLPREDHDVAKVTSEALRRLGVDVLTAAKVGGIRSVKGGVIATIEPIVGTGTAAGSGKRMIGEPADWVSQTIAAEVVVIATGKRPSWGRLGAVAAGVKLTERGAPILNRFLQTSNRSVYAAGDAAGRMLFTSVAHREGAVAGRNAVRGNRETLDLRVVPRGTYGDPEVGSVGLTEEEARRTGINISVGLAPFGALSKALVTGEPMGLVKLICDRKTGEIIGGHVAGHSASELVHVIAVAMRGRLTYRDLAEMIYAFPTYAEAVNLAALNVE